MGVGQKKIRCGRKHKFGLNCQAVAIIIGKILDISVAYGALAADFVAFDAPPPPFRRLSGERGRRQGQRGQRTATGDRTHRRRCAGRGREHRTGRSVANTTREWCKS